MPHSVSVGSPDSFTTFGELLHFLRRRARLKQRDLAIASGYSEAQISRLEQNQRIPDPITLSALIIPALDLDHEPELAERLLNLATAARAKPAPSLPAAQPAPARAADHAPGPPAPAVHLSAIPVPPPGVIPRSGELARLKQQLLLNRHVALCGMAGVGKTTLAAALARDHARDNPVCWLNLSAQITTLIDTIIVQLSQFLHDHGATAVAPLLTADTLGAPLPLDRQIALICAGFAHLAATAAPLICVDNVYLVQYTQPVQQLLTALMTTTPTTILLISRETVPVAGFTSIMLRGLTATEAVGLMSRLSADSAGLTPDLALRLHAKVDGNPLLIRLALGQLFDHAADPAGLIARLETTPQIAGYVLETVQQRLTPAAWRLCAVLAVIREPVNLYDEVLRDLWDDAADFGDLAAATAALQQHLLIADPQAATLPPLLRDQIGAALLPDPTLRRRLHRLAARWATQAQGDPLQAVYHYARADALPEATAILSNQIDALHAQGRALAAVRLVDELLARVRRQSGAEGFVGRLLLSRAELLAGTLRTGEAEADYRAALAAAAAPALQALAGIRLAHYLAQHGRPAEALRACADVRDRLDAPDPLLQLELAVAEAQAYSNLGQYAAALQAAEVALPTAVGASAVRLRATLHAQIGTALYAQRNLSAAREQLRQAIVLAEQTGQSRAAERYRGAMAHLLLTGGDPAGALRMLDTALPAVRAAGDIVTLEYLLSLQMLGRFLRGEYAAAGEHLDAALALRHSLGLTLGGATDEGHYAYVLIGCGRLAEARDLLQRLLDQPADALPQRALGYNRCRLALLELLAGAAPAAQQTIRSVLELPVTAVDARLNAEAETVLAVALLVGGLPVRAARLVAADVPPAAGVWVALERLLVRAMIAAALGEAASAQQMLAELAARAVATGHGHYHAVAARLRGVVDAPFDPAELPQVILGRNS